MKQGEVGRTSFARIPHRKNVICICCKAGSPIGNGQVSGLIPEQITDKAALKVYEDYYIISSFKAYNCLSCGYEFSEWERKE